MAKLLLNQLKHLASALRIHVCLQGNPHLLPQLEQNFKENERESKLEMLVQPVSFG